MSQENVEVVAASWAAYARGDYETSLGAYAENTIWDDTQYRPDGAIHVGHRALVEVARTWRGTWNRYEIEAEQAVDAGGDRVAVVLRETGKGKDGGIELTSRVTVRDGKIVHTVAYRRPEIVLEAAGLSE